MVNKLTERQRKVLIEMVGKCQACGCRINLEVHRIIRGVDGGTYIPSNIQILCHDCHKMRDFI